MKTRLNRIPLDVFPLIVCLILLSCKNSPVEPENHHGIVWGQSIEGIRIGDDSATVVKKIGLPDYTTWLDADGKIFYYVKGDYAYMFLYVINSGKHIGVTMVEVEGPYKGRINDGIGLGSTRAEALRQLGQPDTTMAEMPSPVDKYEFDQCGFSITYDSLKVLRVAMGTPRFK